MDTVILWFKKVYHCTWVALAVPVVLVGVWYALIGGWYLHQHHGDWTAFVYFGQTSKFTETYRLDQVLIADPGDGYDGQFYYALARQPFSFLLADQPSIELLRQQRIGYPLLTWLLSGFGQPQIVPIALVSINFVAILAGTMAVAIIAASLGRNPLWALAYGLQPGLLFGFLFDLTEPVAFGCVALACLFLHRKQYWMSSLLLLCAGLTKETTLLFPLIWLCVSYMHNHSRSEKIAAAVPLLGWFAWMVWLATHLPISPYVGIVSFDFSTPFVGWFFAVRQSLLLDLFSWKSILAISWYAVIAITATLSLIAVRREVSRVSLTAVAYALWLVIFAPTLLLFPKEYTRNLLGLFLAVLLMGLSAQYYTWARWLPAIAASFSFVFILILWQQGTLFW